MFKNVLHRMTLFVKAHRLLSAISLIIIVVLIVVGYKKTHSTAAQTRYVLGTVEKGTLISSVTGSGQIASVNQVDIKPKVSGDIISINVSEGQTVAAGAIIARLNATDALKSLRDAEQNLTSAQITYQKALQSSQTSLSNAKDSLQKSYDDAYNAITDAFSTLPTTMDDLSDILYNQNHSPYLSNSNLNSLVSQTLVNEKDTAGKEFDVAKNEFEKNLSDFKATTRSSDPAVIEALISESYQTVKDISTAEKDLNTLLNHVQSLSKTLVNQFTTDATTVSTALSKSSGYVSSLYNAKTSIADAKNTLASQTSSLNGNDTLDIQSAKLALAQKQSAVNDAYTNLADYTLRAPFEGTIAKLDVQVANSASSGTTIATLITKDSYATLTLNEIDIAKVKVGNKATLTFDALPDLSITGTVAEVDSIGTVSQGVVSYGVKIRFDTQDERVKAGMSVSAAIITGSKPNVLMVPSSAIKTVGGVSYVQVLDAADSAASSSSAQTGVTSATPPRQVPVEIGDSNDSSVEIISGIQEGDRIVTRTVTSTVTAARTPSSNATFFGGGNAVRATGGAVRTTTNGGGR